MSQQKLQIAASQVSHVIPTALPGAAISGAALLDLAEELAVLGIARLQPHRLLGVLERGHPVTRAEVRDGREVIPFGISRESHEQVERVPIPPGLNQHPHLPKFGRAV